MVVSFMRDKAGPFSAFVTREANGKLESCLKNSFLCFGDKLILAEQTA